MFVIYPVLFTNKGLEYFDEAGLRSLDSDGLVGIMWIHIGETSDFV